MATFNFYLKEPNSKKETTIFLKINMGNKHFKVYTGLYLYPKYWNKNQKKVKRSFELYTEMNKLLNTMKNFVQSAFYEEFSKHNDINIEKIRKSFDARFKNKTKKESFYDRFEEFVEVHKSTRTKGVIKNYSSTINKLKKFEKAKKFPLSYDKINYHFYETFLNYLFKQERLLTSSSGKYIKILKTFMNWSLKKGYTENNKFKDFKVLDEEADTVYLTEEELNKITKLDLNENPLLEYVRNFFLFECYSGLRISDINNLKEVNIKRDELSFRSKKTKEIRRIPVSEKAKKYLTGIINYQGKKPLEQVINRKIKEICYIAGIDEPQERVSMSGSKRIVNTKPKYEFISSHTGKRTFITLSLQKGMRPEVVMKITGNKDYRSFKKYIRLANSVLKEEIDRAWK